MKLFDYRSFLPRLFVFGLALLFAGGEMVMAQTVSFRGNVGASFFRSPDLQSEVLNSGTSLGLETGIRVYRGLEITAGGSYDGFTLNEDNARLFGSGGADLSFLSGTLGLRYTYRNGSDAHPYLATGVGLYRLQSTNRREVSNGELVSAGEKREEVKKGVHLAIGSLFRLDDTYAVFFEPRYVFYDLGAGIGDSARYFTLRLGIDIDV